ncbi:MAG: glycosyltransferase family 4 protein [Bacteroidaceae bacterium]|nr:glycosyltransferase family 4 protein [Bacteroidaceae bacterium]
MKKLCILTNTDWYFMLHRKDIALEAKQKGWDVTVLSPDTGYQDEIKNLGLKPKPMTMTRAGLNIFEELKTVWHLYRCYRKECPDVVHHVGMKAILWGTLAAKLAGVPGVVNAVNGLGEFFSGGMNRLLVITMIRVQRWLLRRDGVRVIFQNHDDKKFYTDNKIIEESQVRYIKGSGVSLTKYPFSPEREEGKIIVMLTARMIVDKGIFTLTQAAEKLRKNYEDKVEFWLVGGTDNHPRAITEEQLKSVCDGSYIKWLGYQTDLVTLFKQCHIVALPSYYMEGLPKVLIEANAIGRPIITTDWRGCRDAVDDEVNGFLIPIKNPDALADKLQHLFDHPALRINMGKNAREKAEREFDINIVVQKHIDIYEELLRTKA